MRYRLIPYLEQVIAQATRDRHAGHARDAARVSRQPARARFRDAIHVRRRAARRADPARRRRSRHRAAAGRVVRPQHAGALRRIAGAALCGASSTSFRCSAAKATRCRSAAPSSTPARSTPSNPLERCGCSASPTQPLDGYRQVKIDDGPRRRVHTVRAMLNVDVQVFGDPSSVERASALTRVAAHPDRSRSPPASPRASAPSLSRCLAERHEARPFRRAARRARRSRRCSPSARSASASTPRYARYDPLAFAPVGSAIEVWHQPLAAPAVARPSRSDERAQRAVDARSRLRRAARPAHSPRSSPARCRRARSRMPASRSSGHTEFFAARTHTPRVVMMLVGGAASDALRVALVTTHLPLRDVPDAITRDGASTETLAIVRRELSRASASPSRGSPCAA